MQRVFAAALCTLSVPAQEPTPPVAFDLDAEFAAAQSVEHDVED